MTIPLSIKKKSTSNLVTASFNFYSRAPSGHVDSAMCHVSVRHCGKREGSRWNRIVIFFRSTVISASGLVAAVN
jgi:hypothetical protein